MRNRHVHHNYWYYLSLFLFFLFTILTTSAIVCNQFSRGVFGMIGAVSPDSFDTLHSYSNTFQMPFVTPWFPEKVSSKKTFFIFFSECPLNLWVNEYMKKRNIYCLHLLNLQVLTPSSGFLDFAISMRPQYHQAIIDTIRWYGWDKIIYLYDSHDGELDLWHNFFPCLFCYTHVP
jgi:hypothetical protein